MSDEAREPIAESVPPAPASRANQILRLVSAGMLVAGLLLFARQLGGFLPAIAGQVEGLGIWGPFAFVLFYAVAVVAFVPGALLTLAGGALFDLFWGTVYVFIAAVIGSSAAFLVSRHLARGAVERRLGRSERFAALDRAIGEHGLKILFLMRLSPVFPFNFLNYAIGLTRISFRDYVLASFGMLPGTVLYVYYGKVVGDVAALASGMAPERGAGHYAVLALGLAATLAVTVVITRIARRALEAAAALPAAPPPTPGPKEIA